MAINTTSQVLTTRVENRAFRRVLSNVFKSIVEYINTCRSKGICISHIKNGFHATSGIEIFGKVVEAKTEMKMIS